MQRGHRAVFADCGQLPGSQPHRQDGGVDLLGCQRADLYLGGFFGGGQRADAVVVVDVKLAAGQDDPHRGEGPRLTDKISDCLEVIRHPARRQADRVKLVDDQHARATVERQLPRRLPARHPGSSAGQAPQSRRTGRCGPGAVPVPASRLLGPVPRPGARRRSCPAGAPDDEQQPPGACATGRQGPRLQRAGSSAGADHGRRSLASQPGSRARPGGWRRYRGSASDSGPAA